MNVQPRPDNCMLALLTCQDELLDQLLEIGRRQLDAIENGRMSELLGLLAEKQPLVDQLADLANRLKTLRENEPSAATVADTNLAECRKLRQTATTSFEELFTLEQQCETLLCDRRDQIGARLQATNNALSAANAYREIPPTTSLGGQLDLSSLD
jgi:flagellar biosynthesis/type III secretory pathway chaperone